MSYGEITHCTGGYGIILVRYEYGAGETGQTVSLGYAGVESHSLQLEEFPFGSNMENSIFILYLARSASIHPFSVAVLASASIPWTSNTLLFISMNSFRASSSFNLNMTSRMATNLRRSQVRSSRRQSADTRTRHVKHITGAQHLGVPKLIRCIRSIRILSCDMLREPPASLAC